MSGSQFQQFNEDLNKMLGSTQTVSMICPLLLSMLKLACSLIVHHCQSTILIINVHCIWGRLKL